MTWDILFDLTLQEIVDRIVAPPLPQEWVRTEIWTGKWFIERSRALFGASLWRVWRVYASQGIAIAVEYFER